MQVSRIQHPMSQAGQAHTRQKSVKLKRLTFSLIMALVLPFGNAQAELDYNNSEEIYKGTYWGGTYGDVTVTAKSSSLDARVVRTYGKAQYGWILNDRFQAEVRLGTASGSATDDGFIIYSALAKPYYDYDNIRLYGLLGFSGFSLSGKNGGDVSISGASYGFGTELFGSKTLSVTFEYQHVVDGNDNNTDYDLNALQFGLNYYFTKNDSFTKNRRSIRSIRP